MTTKTPEEWQREVDALKEPARLFGELMAVMHGDGGHYLAEHGAQKSYDDAVAKHHALRAERDSATAEVKLLREEMAVCVGERDEARAERDEARHYVDHKPNCRAMSPGISQREVDALRAENARLRDVCDAADVIRDSLYISPSMEIIYAAGSNEIEALRDALDAAEWVYFSTATVEADPSKRADMGALIRRLARRLDPADPLRIAATQYLSQHGLHGRPLRGGGQVMAETSILDEITAETNEQAFAECRTALGHLGVWRVVDCCGEAGPDLDIVECSHCGARRVERCNFDEDMS